MLDAAVPKTGNQLSDAEKRPSHMGRTSVTCQDWEKRQPGLTCCSRSLLKIPFEGGRGRDGVSPFRLLLLNKYKHRSSPLAFRNPQQIPSSFHLLHLPSLPSRMFSHSDYSCTSRLKTRKVVVVVKVRVYDALLQLVVVVAAGNRQKTRTVLVLMLLKAMQANRSISWRFPRQALCSETCAVPGRL